MIKYHYDITQGSDEWHQIRLGLITASNINLLVTPTGKPAKNEKMRLYACQIAAQREMQIVEDNYQSFDMIRGHLQEDIARGIYHDKFSPVRECGFITNDAFGPIIGCSPDGLVEVGGGIEIKSRLAKLQFQTIVADEVPQEYLNQIETFLLVSDRKWCDFVQYSNGLPLYVKRVVPDLERRESIIAAAVAFEAEVQLVLDAYRENSHALVKTEYVDFIQDDIMQGSE